MNEEDNIEQNNTSSKQKQHLLFNRDDTIKQRAAHVKQGRHDKTRGDTTHNKAFSHQPLHCVGCAIVSEVLTVLAGRPSTRYFADSTDSLSHWFADY